MCLLIPMQYPYDVYPGSPVDCRNHCSLDPWICLLKVPSKAMVLKWGKSTKQYNKTHLNLWNPRAFIFIYTWNPNDPCFDWKRPCFGGLKPQNRGQTGSRYIYICIHIHIYLYIRMRCFLAQLKDLVFTFLVFFSTRNHGTKRDECPE